MDTQPVCPICGQVYSCRCEPRTRKQVREVIREAILAEPTVPSLTIAKQVGCSDKTVASVRAELIEDSEIPNSVDRPYQRMPWMMAPGNPSREPHDFYSTPAVAVECLLEQEAFYGTIWEPACGDGAISEVLKSRLPDCEVISTDLVDRGYGSGGVDFLREEIVVDHIVTNPPYQERLALSFARHAIECASHKVALLLPLYWLEGIERSAFLAQSPLRAVYVFSRRIQCLRGGERGAGGLPSAWFVWERGYEGEPVIRWLSPPISV